MTLLAWLRELVGLDAQPPRAPKLTEPRRIYTTMGDEAANLPVFNSCDEGVTLRALQGMRSMTREEVAQHNFKMGIQASTPRSLSSGEGLCTDGTDSRCVTPTPPPLSGSGARTAEDGSTSDRASESVHGSCHYGEVSFPPIISKSEAQYFHAYGKDIG
jgi:hypothetical protein